VAFSHLLLGRAEGLRLRQDRDNVLLEEVVNQEVDALTGIRAFAPVAVAAPAMLSELHIVADALSALALVEGRYPVVARGLINGGRKGCGWL